MIILSQLLQLLLQQHSLLRSQPSAGLLALAGWGSAASAHLNLVQPSLQFTYLCLQAAVLRLLVFKGLSFFKA